MSIAAQLEARLRTRVEQRLENARTLIVEDMKRTVRDAAALNQGTSGEITGQLFAGFIVDPWSTQGDAYASTVRSLASYSAFLEYGTGIYGPTGDYIRPRRPNGVLAFYWYKIGANVVTRKVRGTRPFNFFYEPMPARFRAALEAG